MPALVQTHANNLIDASLGTATFTATVTPLKVRLVTTTSTALAAGVEVANAGGSSYAPQIITFAVAATGSATNNVTLNFTNMPATTVLGVELWDSSGTPARKWFGALQGPKATSLGDTFQISSGALTAALA